jgi:hypothetical protein
MRSWPDLAHYIVACLLQERKITIPNLCVVKAFYSILNVNFALKRPNGRDFAPMY